MDELAAKLVERDARRERSRFRWAWTFAVGSPIFAGMITAAAFWIDSALQLGLKNVCEFLAIANAALAATGSGFGVWLEPGSTPRKGLPA